MNGENIQKKDGYLMENIRNDDEWLTKQRTSSIMST